MKTQRLKARFLMSAARLRVRHSAAREPTRACHNAKRRAFDTPADVPISPTKSIRWLTFQSSKNLNVKLRFFYLLIF